MILKEKIQAKSIYQPILQLKEVKHVSPLNNEEVSVSFYIKNIRLKSCRIIILNDYSIMYKKQFIVNDNNTRQRIITDKSDTSDKTEILINDINDYKIIENNYIDINKTYTEEDKNEGKTYYGGLITFVEDFQIKFPLGKNDSNSDKKIFIKFIYYDYDGNLIINHDTILVAIQHGSIEDYDEYMELYNIYNNKTNS